MFLEHVKCLFYSWQKVSWKSILLAIYFVLIIILNVIKCCFVSFMTIRHKSTDFYPPYLRLQSHLVIWDSVRFARLAYIDRVPYLLDNWLYMSSWVCPNFNNLNSHFVTQLYVIKYGQKLKMVNCTKIKEKTLTSFLNDQIMNSKCQL